MNKAARSRVNESRRKAKERTSDLRAAVLDVVKDLESFRDKEGNRVEASHLRHIIDTLNKRAWDRSFKSAADLERAVDAALQYHRRRGALEFWPGHGWETKPVTDEGLQGSSWAVDMAKRRIAGPLFTEGA